MANLFYAIDFVIFVEDAITEFPTVCYFNRNQRKRKSIVPYKRPEMILRTVMHYVVRERMTLHQV